MLPFTAVLDDKMLVSWARQLTFALYRFTNCTPPPSLAVTCLEIKYPGQINTPEWGQKEGRGEETRSGA